MVLLSSPVKGKTGKERLPEHFWLAFISPNPPIIGLLILGELVTARRPGAVDANKQIKIIIK